MYAIKLTDGQSIAQLTHRSRRGGRSNRHHPSRKINCAHRRRRHPPQTGRRRHAQIPHREHAPAGSSRRRPHSIDAG